MAARKKDGNADPIGFEQHLEALETVVNDLEGEGLTLEDSLARYKQGVGHLRACRAMLDDAEARLAELVADGEERPLEVTERGLEDA
jgi:exodeoxyribonuclease VII small subunit